ncbi:MAG: SiaB family protein kinase [Magnetococcus sp. YQC-3]
MSHERDDFFSLHEKMKRDGVLIYFSGPFTQKMMLSLGFSLRKKITDADTPNKAARAFSIFVELAQNIISYSDERIEGTEQQTGLGVISVREEAGTYYIDCGNTVAREASERITKKIDAMQNLDQAALKALYKKQLQDGPDEKSAGAGLGFIEMARRASEPLTYKIVEMDNGKVFISVTATVY